MGNMTRRNFVKTTSVLAAGAAATGLGLSLGEKFRGRRDHGPVQFKMYFWSENAHLLKGSVFSDDRCDLFGMQIDFDHWGKTTVHTSLRSIKQVVEEGHPWILGLNVIADGKRKSERLFVKATREGDKFVMREVGKTDAPFWMDAKDVRQVTA